MCAILYENSYYNGWAYKVSETDSENILDIYNNEATSIKLRNGCTFKGYRYANKGDLMFTTVDDMEDFEDFDQAVSSYSCECASSKIYGLYQIIGRPISLSPFQNIGRLKICLFQISHILSS